MKTTITAIVATLLFVTTLPNHTAFAEELLIQKMVMGDNTVPFEIQAVATNEFDRHVNRTEPLYKEIISPSVFSLSNNSTYMLFEFSNSTGNAHLRMFVRISNETGQVDKLWAKEVGLLRRSARR